MVAKGMPLQTSVVRTSRYRIVTINSLM